MALAALVALGTGGPVAGGGQGALVLDAFEHEGLRVDLRVESVERDGETLHVGDDVRVSFRITDTATGSPQTTLEPAAWLHPADANQSCVEKVEGFLSGALGSRAQIDLNAFYVLTLNSDASISVVDPLFGFGGSKLLALAVLSSPGESWVLGQDQRELFVTLPISDAVAVVDTATWKTRVEIPTAPEPAAVGLQPDGRYLWVGCDGQNAGDPRSGVTVIDAESLERVTDLPTGAGHHELAFSADSRYAFVSNDVDGTVSVIDVWEMEVVRELEGGERPVDLAWSPLAEALYVVDEAGVIRVYDGRTLEPVRTIEAEPGLRELAFAPEGRLAILVNTAESLVHVLDAASHRIVQTGEVGDHPDQVSFTPSLAYVRSLRSELVWMIPLAELGREGSPVPIVDFSGGHSPFGASSGPASAPGIVAAPGGTAVLVANPSDGAVYYYREGMAAPMGHFKTYRREPRAVLMVDRSLREGAPGVYSTEVRLESAGANDLVFFLDTPRIVHCFSVEVAPEPGAAPPERPRLRVEPLLDEMGGATLTIGAETRLLFRVRDGRSGRPEAALRDFGIVAFNTGGWQRRAWTKHVGEGLYETTFTPPTRGAYYVFPHCPSRDMPLKSISPLILRAVERPAASGGAGAEPEEAR